MDPLPIGNCNAIETEVRPGSMGLPLPYPTATDVIVHGLLRLGAEIEISAVAVLPG